MLPVDVPPFADSETVSVNRAIAEHPVKSIVTGTIVEPFGGMYPTGAGNDGPSITGVHAAPKVCVRAKELMVVPNAALGPLSTSMFQMREFCTPAFEEIPPDRGVAGQLLIARSSAELLRLGSRPVRKS